MTKIMLLGPLGKKFGREHRFEIRTPAEAIRAFVANFPEFKKFLMDAGKQNLGFRVLMGKDEMPSVEDINEPLGRRTLKIVPIVMGSGAVGKIVAGAALIVAAIYASPFIISANILNAAGLIGARLVYSGVSELLTHAPQNQPSDTNQSYIFNGPINTSQQGLAVPVGYGRLIVGSAVISASITTEDQSV